MAPQPKKIVSISGLFAKHSACGRENARGVDKPGRIAKTSHQKKHAIIPEHILARDLSEKIEISRTQILQDFTSRLESTHHVLLDRLAITSAKSASFVEEAMTAKDTLTRLLAMEKLQFTGKDGKPSGIVLLGDRMKRFKKVVAREEKELASLWMEWAEVQELIAGVGVELLGSQAMGALAQQSMEPVTSTDSAELRKIAQEIEEDKETLKKEIEQMSKGLIEKMYTGEKEMETKTQKRQQEFLTALGAED